MLLLLLLVAPRLLAEARGGAATAHPLVSKVGPRPLEQRAPCWNKQPHFCFCCFHEGVGEATEVSPSP